MSEVPPAHELLGESNEDRRDIKACSTTSFTAFGSGMEAYDWEHPSRVIPSPPQIENGPFTELRLAPSPAAAVAAIVIRQRTSSDQRSMLSIVRDAKRGAIYRVKAPGVRIKNGRRDGRLVAGTMGLRIDGEQAQERLEDRVPVATGVGGTSEEMTETGSSKLWSTVANAFDDESIAAIEFPDDSKHPTLQMDWPLVAEVPRLETLTAAKLFSLDFMGQNCVRWRDFLRMKDVAGRAVGWRFLYYVARETAHDAISLSRRKGMGDWVRFIAALLTLLSSLGSLGWLLSRVL
jgi:hypothetical protein